MGGEREGVNKVYAMLFNPEYPGVHYLSFEVLDRCIPQ